ncbi:quaternary amine ABC transporter ATP-binding protein [Desulfospira joergensenii]|uniref:quaternary amine ABC transporter ATP-binding protein n=1 Tax=Desulfospira joergensenii TaxID=53329 RepID=UPI0003B566EA|nr:glycine betaine/L-proline ABC transporter ATP-binding protein [Desulfospira joergensenii]
MSKGKKSKIQCRNLWKIFGPEPDQIIPNWDQHQGLNKVELLKKTGCVVGTRDASFEVEEGEIFCLMGLSGSGKSTLLRCINRLHMPTSGEVFVDGLNITSLPDDALRGFRRSKTGMVFQHFALLPHRRLIENAGFGLEVQGIDKAVREKKAAEALELVGLKGWEKSYPYELSGGMQQRVGLARALATDPSILLMDEAFSALDPLIRRQMQDEFVNLIKKVNKTIVFVTHDLNEALRIAGHIAVMKDGFIVQQGTPAELVLHPESSYVEEFVRDLPKIKFVTAGDIMEDVGVYRVKPEDTAENIINKMDHNNLRFVYLTDSDQGIVGVLDYFQIVGEQGICRTKQPPSDQRIIRDFPVARTDTFLEELLTIGSGYRIPIAVRDERDRLIGVISRETLLTALTKV